MKSEATPGRDELRQQIADMISAGVADGLSPDEVAGNVLLTCRLEAKPAEEMREATIEECAKILDGCAQDWNRIRDPGMANNARAYAKKIRALSTTTEPKR